MQIFSVFRLLQDLSRPPHFKLDLARAGPLGHYLRKAEHKLLPGRSASGRKIQDYKRNGARDSLKRSGGARTQAEGAHYPLAWRDGGPAAEIENHRLVHRTCHPPGRPAASFDRVDPGDL